MAGLSNAQDYKLSKHFMARANERFGIKNIVVSKWFRKQRERITEVDETEIEEEIFNKYEKKDKNFENPETIHEVNLIGFKKELIALQRKYELMDSVELLNNIDADIERFYHSFHRIKDGNLTSENWEVLQLLIDSAHVINHVIKMIERKRKDYRYLKDKGMEEQYLDDSDDEL